MIGFKAKANYWEAQFTQYKSREDLLRAEVEALKAKLRKREQQLFGKKSEHETKKSDVFTAGERDFNPPKKKRPAERK